MSPSTQTDPPQRAGTPRAWPVPGPGGPRVAPPLTASMSLAMMLRRAQAACLWKGQRWQRISLSRPSCAPCSSPSPSRQLAPKPPRFAAPCLGRGEDPHRGRTRPGPQRPVRPMDTRIGEGAHAVAIQGGKGPAVRAERPARVRQRRQRRDEPRVWPSVRCGSGRWLARAWRSNELPRGQLVMGRLSRSGWRDVTSYGADT